MEQIKTLTEYANDIMVNRNNPHLLSEMHLEIAVKYAFMSEIFKELILEKAIFESNVKYEKEKPLSDKAVESKWLQEEGGKKEIRLRYEMKALEKLMGAIKSSIVVSSNEAKNQM